jgi:cation diffusion facilitator family transporter
MSVIEQQRYKAVKKVTIVNATTNILLAVFKIFYGVFGHSHALFADGIHSLADLLSDLIVIVATKYGSMTRDHDHPYGHGKIETLGTAALSLVLVVVGVGIAIDALRELFIPSHSLPQFSVLLTAVLSIVANEALFRYNKYIANQLDSHLLLANAWHHRSDALSSVVVLVGVVGTMQGWVYLDACAAVIVALLIVRMGWQLVWRSLRELIDTAVDEKTLAAITALIQNVPGVKQLHECRTRYMRNTILVDVHIIVDSYLSVSEGHHIAQHVHRSLQREMPKVVDVTVHVDPEDDELYPPSIDLPSRRELEALLAPYWQQLPGFSEMRLTLHYLAGKLWFEVALPEALLSAAEKVRWVGAAQQAKQAHPDIERVDMLYYARVDAS